MDELMDMIAADESPSGITDKIKEILYAKAADKIDNHKPAVANTMFADAEESEE